VLAAIFVFDRHKDLVIDMGQRRLRGQDIHRLTGSSIHRVVAAHDRRRRVVRFRRGQSFRLAEAEDLHKYEQRYRRAEPQPEPWTGPAWLRMVEQVLRERDAYRGQRNHRGKHLTVDFKPPVLSS
jgi:hypothetical protein